MPGLLKGTIGPWWWSCSCTNSIFIINLILLRFFILAFFYRMQCVFLVFLCCIVYAYVISFVFVFSSCDLFYYYVLRISFVFCCVHSCLLLTFAFQIAVVLCDSTPNQKRIKTKQASTNNFKTKCQKKKEHQSTIHKEMSRITHWLNSLEQRSGTNRNNTLTNQRNLRIVTNLCISTTRIRTKNMRLCAREQVQHTTKQKTK